jgi:hypothetical protein
MSIHPAICSPGLFPSGTHHAGVVSPLGHGDRMPLTQEVESNRHDGFGPIAQFLYPSHRSESTDSIVAGDGCRVVPPILCTSLNGCFAYDTAATEEHKKQRFNRRCSALHHLSDGFELAGLTIPFGQSNNWEKSQRSNHAAH